MYELKKKIGQYARTMDYCLLLTALLCSAFGLVLIFSATHSLDGGSTRFIMVQSLAIVLGLIGFVVLTCFDLEKYVQLWRIVLIVNILFQLSLLLFGYEDGGNKSWLRFGGIGIQPAELGKLLFIFTFAKQINLLRYRLNRVRSLLMLGAHLLAVMAAIILPSHDVGMSLPYVFIAVLMLFAAGLSLKWFAGGAILACAAVPVMWNVLSGIQRDRILVLFDPSISPNTYWQQEQSRIAIGAGRLLGTGFLKGNQTQNNMLPEKQTDFIFGVAGEEWGLVGCMVIVLALMVLIVRVFYVAFHAHSQIASLICTGVGSMLLFQTYENIFMCLGIGPVMGLTLPFFSYGGSSVVTMYLALGMVVGVTRFDRRRYPAGHLTEEHRPVYSETEELPARGLLGGWKERLSGQGGSIHIDWVPKLPKLPKKKRSGRKDHSEEKSKK